MKNKIVELNNNLFEALERLNDDELTDEQIDKEIERGKAIALIAKNIIANGNLALKAETLVNEYNIEEASSAVTEVLGIESDDQVSK